MALLMDRIHCHWHNKVSQLQINHQLENFAMKSLRLNKDIRMLQEDKGSCTVVLDESKYNNKLNTLVEYGAYELLPKDPTAKDNRKVQIFR
jgi:hypothetical protein